MAVLQTIWRSRHGRALALLVSTGVLACVAGAVPAAAIQAPALPAARDIFARHVKAIGGEAAFKAVKSAHARGQLSLAAQGITGDFEMFAARPSSLLTRVTIAGMGAIESGYNGSIGWSDNPATGPELLAGRMLDEAADDAWFDAPLHDSAHVQQAQTTGQVDFDGHQAYKVRVVLRSGDEQTEYYDVSSGLEIGSEGPRAMPQGIVPTVNIMRDYRQFGPLKQPATLVQRALGFEQVLTISSYEFDTVSPTVFDPPASVKALMRP
jgi:hypothetical protein